MRLQIKIILLKNNIQNNIHYVLISYENKQIYSDKVEFTKIEQKVKR